jgi:hypothetical protein
MCWVCAAASWHAWDGNPSMAHITIDTIAAVCGYMGGRIGEWRGYRHSRDSLSSICTIHEVAAARGASA